MLYTRVIQEPSTGVFHLDFQELAISESIRVVVSIVPSYNSISSAYNVHETHLSTTASPPAQRQASRAVCPAVVHLRRWPCEPTRTDLTLRQQRDVSTTP